jgi:glyoxylase-like metal-dependent hydrolase (beta-lactamase superfamily II)
MFEPAQSVRQLLERSAEAVGGLARLRAIAAVRVEEQGHEYLLSIPGDPRGPKRVAVQRLATLRRAEPAGVRATTDQLFPMRPEHFAQTTVATANAAAVVRGGTMAAGAVSDLEGALGDYALAPERVLLTALAAPTARAEHDTTIAGTRYHIVSFAMPGAQGRAYLAINARTSFPDRVRLERAYPALVYWAMWGRISIETVWSSWSLDANGVWYPRQRTLTFNGAPFREYSVTALDLAAAAPADSFAIPDSLAAHYAAAASAPPRTPQLTPVTLADGITLFQGGYQAAIVREPAGVIVIEAPESDAKSRAVLQECERLYPGVPVSAVVSTSPAWMHIGGLPEYARRRIPIYALDMDGAEIQELLAAPRADGNGAALQRARVIPVSESLTLGSGQNRMQLIPARGIHAAAMMLVYWPAHQLLYASDVVIPPAFEPVFTSAYDADLRRILDRLQLPVTTMYSLHLPPSAWHPNGDGSATGGSKPAG